MKAAGAYLKVMREQLGISQAELARRIKASSSQIHRIEEGPGETRPSLVAAAAIAVQANPEDLIKLLADDKLGQDEGADLARRRIAITGESGLPPPPVHPEVVALAVKMSEFQLGKWVAVGERILEE